ncbi:DUF4214 domain-containing protein [Acidihalobacter aeolianus]|uniref:DUF4214 domain-containing protein n=1 Tax=Acidihalobacter aeolianus TaxID=2792603 RepID=UPI0009F7049A|nr:DUF4214 domain-containing protein [Acidihalobacter aeolianus]
MDLIQKYHEIINLTGVEFIRGAYEFIFKRDSDAIGLEYYLNRLRAGYSKTSIINQMLASNEARGVIEINNYVTASNDLFIKEIYWALLKRQVDSGGLSHYLHRLELTKDRRKIVDDILMSDEYRSIKYRLRKIKAINKEYARKSKSAIPLLSSMKSNKLQQMRLNSIEHELSVMSKNITEGLSDIGDMLSGIKKASERESISNRLRNINMSVASPKEKDNYIGYERAYDLPKILHRVYFYNYAHIMIHFRIILKRGVNSCQNIKS